MSATVPEILQPMFAAAVEAAFGDIKREHNIPDRALTPVVTFINPKFADYQCPSPIGMFKVLKGKGESAPKSAPEVADAILANLPEEFHSIATTKLEKKHFIHIFLKKEWLTERVAAVLANDAPVPPKVSTEKVIVDFSSPNIAKSMHVGHLRSTIIGDTICRLHEYLGSEVDRVNHVGDWGTQFGMLISHLEEKFPHFDEGVPIDNLVAFYKEAKTRFDEDADFKKASQEKVVKLQQGGETELRAWKILCDISRREFQRIYDALDIKLREVGESFYNPMIPPIIQKLMDEGRAVIDDGAVCVFVKGEKVPLILRKSDGGFGYDSTDMAAINYRLFECDADRVIYVTDAGQEPHFRLVFKAASEAGWIERAEKEHGRKPVLQHVGFGLVCGEDGKKFATRSGATVKLQDLLDEGVKRVKDLLIERQQESAEMGDNAREIAQSFDDEEMTKIATAVGFGAIKYADLSSKCTLNYTFSFDRMLQFRGNTAVYLLYALTRMRAIFRKAGVEKTVLLSEENRKHFRVVEESEKNLALVLSKFSEMIQSAVFPAPAPHKICEYLYNVSTAFTSFYSNCRCILAEDDERRYEVVGDFKRDIQVSRLQLVHATQVTMEKCFELLGITTVDKM